MVKKSATMELTSKGPRKALATEDGEQIVLFEDAFSHSEVTISKEMLAAVERVLEGATL